MTFKQLILLTPNQIVHILREWRESSPAFVPMSAYIKAIPFAGGSIYCVTQSNDAFHILKKPDPHGRQELLSESEIAYVDRRIRVYFKNVDWSTGKNGYITTFTVEPMCHYALMQLLGYHILLGEDIPLGKLDD